MLVVWVGVSKFGSVRFLPEKTAKSKKKRDPKPNRNRPKPAGSGPVFYPKNRTNL